MVTVSVGLRGLAVGAVALLASACGGPPERLPREARIAVFRDLILYDRDPGRGGPFFLARFETTRAEWRAYLLATGAGGPLREPEPERANLPATGISLVQARAYARWRWCRVPSFSEWRYAATGRGAYRYPWGNRFRPEWVNTWSLGLDEPTPIGTFESGRERGGAYDLYGNVAEWTESIASHWLGDVGGRWGSGAVRRTAAMAPWLLRGLPAPAWWVLESWSNEFPRLVVGGHFRSPFTLERSPLADQDRAGVVDGLGWLWERAPRERGDTVGVRLATTPLELLVALLWEPTEPGSADRGELRRFLARRGHRPALRAAVDDALAVVPDPGPLGQWLLAEIGP